MKKLQLRPWLAAVALAVWCASASADPVTFNINMSVQAALGKFNAGAGDSVWLMGLTNDWSTGLPMTASSDPDIFTFSTSLAAASWPNYKFVIKPATGSWIWEDGGNRYFQVPTGGTNLPAVYFNNVTNMPAGPVEVTFQLSMKWPIVQGQFAPGMDYVSVFGSFDNWGQSGLVLTNVPGTSNYVGVLATSALSLNTTVYYKYAINGYGGVWEGNVGPNNSQNRSFVLTNSTQTLPLDFWNNVTNVLATNLISFQVNMAGEDALGTFTPGVNTVFVNGDWNWSGAAFQLTQAGSSDLYTGAVQLAFAPGSTVNYKYAIDGGYLWEQDGVGPNAARDRQFVMTTSTNLPMDYFNNRFDLGPLFISRSGSDVTLTWPAGTNTNNRIRLQSSSSFSTWSDISAAQGQSTYTGSFGPGPVFFRLTGP